MLDLATQAKKAALSRWKLETLTGLLGYRSAKHHQAERERNIEAENRKVRKELWGDTNAATSVSDDMGHTILGDYHPPQVIMASHPSNSGLGKVLAGAALGASLLGIPGAGLAGFLLSRMQPQTQQEPKQQENESVNLGLLRIDDLKQ